VSLSNCEPSKRQNDVLTCSHDPSIYSQTWLSFAVIPPLCRQKARISAVNAGSVAVFPHISETGARSARQ